MTFATFIRSAAIAFAVVLGAGTALAGSEVPAPGQSPKIDAIKARGTLKAAAIGEFPWLPENTTGSGPQFSGPAWMLAEEYAKRLGVKLEIGAGQPRDQGADPGDRRSRHLDRAALGHAEARRRSWTSWSTRIRASACSASRTIRSCKAAKTVDDLNRDDITIAYFTGTPPETWAPTRFPKATLQGRCRARAPMRRSRRSWPGAPTSPHRQRRLAAAPEAGAGPDRRSRLATTA